MLIEHEGARPRIDETAYIAPTAVVCGDVTVGPDTQVAFGAVIVAEGGPVVLGSRCIVRENAIIRGTPRHPVNIGDQVLIGPRASLIGCSIEDDAFLATGVAVFHGARVGKAAEVRVGGVVHVNSAVAPRETVPIGWIAVGDPAQLFPPEKHEEIWAVQKTLNFPQTVYGLGRNSEGRVDMKEVTRRLAEGHARHRTDVVLPAAKSPTTSS